MRIEQLEELKHFFEEHLFADYYTWTPQTVRDVVGLIEAEIDRQKNPTETSEYIQGFIDGSKRLAETINNSTNYLAKMSAEIKR